MSFTQLHPTIPMTTPRGKGYAIGVIDYSTEHNICWVVGLDNGEIWTFQNPEVRMQSNVTMGRGKSDSKPLCGDCGHAPPSMGGCMSPTCPYHITQQDRLAKRPMRDYSPWTEPSPNTAQSSGE